MNRKDFARAAGLLTVLTVVAKFVGFLRQTVLNAYFGATATTDAWVAARTIPDLIWMVIATALSTTVVPAYTSEAVHDRARADRLASSLILIAALAGLIVGLPLWLLAEPILRLLEPGFTPEQIAQSASLSRVILPMMIWLGVSAVLTGVLQALRRFTAPALAPIWQNLAVITMIVIMASRWGIMAAAVGLLVGTMLQALGQLPGLRGTGFRFHWRIDWRQPALAEVGRLVLPVLAGMIVVQLNPVINRMLASMLPHGSLSMLENANLLYMLPVGLFTQAVGVVIYPALAERSEAGDARGRLRLLVRGLDLAVIVSLPVLAGIVLLGEPLIRLLFEHGRFGAAATAGTASALTMYALALPAAAGFELVRRTYYAAHETRRPMQVSVAAVVLNIALSFLLVRPLAQAGLALANAIATWFQFFVLSSGFKGLAAAMRKERGKWFRILLATLGMAAALGAFLLLWPAPGPATRIVTQAAWLAAAAAIGLGIYAALLELLHVPEWEEGVELLRQRLVRLRGRRRPGT